MTFAIPLAAPLDEEHVHKPSNANFADFCTGTAAAPTAPAGHLCVYIGFGLSPLNIQEAAGTQVGASTAGASLFFTNENEFNFPARGTYAVTAP